MKHLMGYKLINEYYDDPDTKDKNWNTTATNKNYNSIDYTEPDVSTDTTTSNGMAKNYKFNNDPKNNGKSTYKASFNNPEKEKEKPIAPIKKLDIDNTPLVCSNRSRYDQTRLCI